MNKNIMVKKNNLVNVWLMYALTTHVSIICYELEHTNNFYIKFTVKSITVKLTCH